MNFTERLKTLPATHHLAALQLLDAHGAVLATIENRPGQTGSLAVYAALAAMHGGASRPKPRRWGWTGTPSTQPMHARTRANTRTSTDCWPGHKARRATRCGQCQRQAPEVAFSRPS